MKKIIQWLCGFLSVSGIAERLSYQVYSGSGGDLCAGGSGAVQHRGNRRAGLSSGCSDRTLDSIADSAQSRAFTISFWFKPEANFEWTTLLSMGRDDRHVMQLATSGNPTGERCGLNYSIQSGNKGTGLSLRRKQRSKPAFITISC